MTGASVAAALAAAKRYAEKGHHVFPVAGKVPPQFSNGLLDATNDPGVVEALWQRWPCDGVAIRTGERLRTGGFLAVLDVDPRHDGDASLQELEEEHGELPNTHLVRTPSGGYHYYFSTPEPLRNRANMRPGLDLRAAGGYVVAAGSPGYSVGFACIAAPMPPWLLELAASPAEGATAPGEMAPPVSEIIPEGTRDNTLASLAGTLRRRGLDAPEILACLEAVNERRCRPPVAPHVVARIAASIARKPVAWPLGAERAAT